MNKLSIMTKGALIALSTVGIAYAHQPFSHYSINSWTGLYVGAETGAVFNNVQLRSQQLGFTNPENTCNTSSDISTFSPGVQLGYLHQFTNAFVSGIEANLLFNSNQKGTLSCNCPFNPDVYDRFSFRNQMQSSIKGRAGHVLNWNNNVLLPYLTAGASFADVGLTYKNEGGDYYSKNINQAGWLIGAGLEWAFKKNWSLRTEYSYVNYGNTIELKIPNIYGLIDPNGNARANLSSNCLVASINYWI